MMEECIGCYIFGNSVLKLYKGIFFFFLNKENSKRKFFLNKLKKRAIELLFDLKIRLIVNDNLD